ncbi:hypothetical protein H0H87_010890 [Tephrocybe sp. NHM501043]|nr:hypothetical protein H0H87_010890 [Tephrocybe sp. NHM501043]
MSATTITISYELNPPVQTVKDAQGLNTSNKIAHEAIAGAKDQLGNELTAWRDAVGKAELSKETTKTLKYDADEEEEAEE